MNTSLMSTGPKQASLSGLSFAQDSARAGCMTESAKDGYLQTGLVIAEKLSCSFRLQDKLFPLYRQRARLIKQLRLLEVLTALVQL